MLFERVLLEKQPLLVEKTGFEYRYGFQGQESDDEVKGAGNSYNFGARMYDARVGRWLSLDPKSSKYPNQSPYHFSGNSPIQYIDPNGEEVIITITKKDGAYVVMLSAKIYLTGEGANKEFKESVQNKVDELFQPIITDGKNGPKISIIYDIQVIDASINKNVHDIGKIPLAVVDANSKGAQDFMMQNRKLATETLDNTGQNIVAVFGQGKFGRSTSSTSANNAIVFDGFDDNYSYDAKIMATIHEIGHLLGFIDRNNGTTPDSEYQNDFMGNPFSPNVEFSVERVPEMLEHFNKIILEIEKTGKLNDNEESIPKNNESY